MAKVDRLTDDLAKASIKGVLSIGNIDEPVCQARVDINKMGMILMGGLNPIAAVCEEGIEVDNKSYVHRGAIRISKSTFHEVLKIIFSRP